MLMLRLLKTALFLTRVLPDPVVRWIFYPLGTLAYLTRPEQRRAIIANQRQVLGQGSGPRLHWQAWRVFMNSLRNYHALLRILTLTDQQIEGLVELRGREYLDEALQRGRGAILLGAHMGNLNLLAPYMALVTPLAGLIVEPVKPPELFEFVSAVRARTGVRIMPADRDGVRQAMRLLRDNGVLALVGDRYLNSNGTSVSFFGRPALLPHGPVVLALRTGAPLIPVTLYSRPGGRQVAELRPPLELVDTGDLRDDLRANMRLVAAAVEESIRVAPHQWVMLDPVWGDGAVDAAPAPRAVRVSRRRLAVAIGAGAALIGLGTLLRMLVLGRRRRIGW